MRALAPLALTVIAITLTACGVGRAPLAQHADFREYSAQEFLDRGFIQVGRLVELPAGEVVRMSYRAGGAYLDLPAPVSLRVSGPDWTLRMPPDMPDPAPSGSVFVATIEGEAVSMTVASPLGVPAARFAPLRDGETAVTVSAGGDASRLVLSIVAISGPVAKVAIAPVRRSVAVDREGRFFLGPRPGPLESVIARDTMELLDLFNAEPVGRWQHGMHYSTGECGSGRCSIPVQALGTLDAPALGTLACTSDGTLTLSTVRGMFRFVREDPAGPSCDAEAARHVLPGDTIGPSGTWRTSWIDLAGRQASIVSRLDAVILALHGQPPAVRCGPCPGLAPWP